MNEAEFTALRAKCKAVQVSYLASVKKTSKMLDSCTSGPLPFKKRFALLAQETVENNAHLLYLDSKRLLHKAALLGYDAVHAGSASDTILLSKE